MSWIRLDDNMLDHEKWRQALREGGDAVLLVWFRLTAWCSRRLTDGRIPANMVAEIAGLERSKSRTRALHALVESGLCARSVCDECAIGARSVRDVRATCAQRECGEITISGYLERNPSAADVRAERDRRAKAQRNYLDRNRVTGHKPITLPEPDPVVTGHAPITHPPRDDVPARPGPSRPVPGEDRKPRKRATPMPDDFDPDSTTLKTAAEARVVDIEREIERMRDWARSKEIRRCDWQATFRNWLRSPYVKTGQPERRANGSGGPQPWMFDELERARREEAANETQ